jgi:dTDP-D-glucose 4,6-dehydratase
VIPFCAHQKIERQTPKILGQGLTGRNLLLIQDLAIGVAGLAALGANGIESFSR